MHDDDTDSTTFCPDFHAIHSTTLLEKWVLEGSDEERMGCRPFFRVAYRTLSSLQEPIGFAAHGCIPGFWWRTLKGFDKERMRSRWFIWATLELWVPCKNASVLTELTCTYSLGQISDCSQGGDIETIKYVNYCVIWKKNIGALKSKWGQSNYINTMYTKNENVEIAVCCFIYFTREANLSKILCTI